MLCVLRRNENKVFYIRPCIYHFQCSLFLPGNLSYQHVISFRPKELAGLPMMDSLGFIWKCVFCLHFWRSFAGHKISSWQFLSLRTLMSFNSFLVSMVLGEKLAVNHINAPVYIRSPFPLATSRFFVSGLLTKFDYDVSSYRSLCI